MCVEYKKSGGNRQYQESWKTVSNNRVRSTTTSKSLIRLFSPFAQGKCTKNEHRRGLWFNNHMWAYTAYCLVASKR